jgi:tripartite-type tricarboxylate transporter receptor subunit TctC
LYFYFYVYVYVYFSSTSTSTTDTATSAPATASAPAAPAKPANPYAGKNVTYIVTTNAGGGYDAYARLIGKYLATKICY